MGKINFNNVIRGISMNDKELFTRISEVENRLNITIPKVYKDFLLKHDGMEFDDGILYGIEEIEDRYLTFEFNKYAPDLIPIGNDNGDYELVMKSGNQIKRFGIVEQGSVGSLEPEHFHNFTQWYNSGHSFEFETGTSNIDGSKRVKVVLKKCPTDKSRTIMKIRKALRLELPITELLRAANNAPVVLTESLTFAVAKKLIAENSLDEWLDIKS